MTHEIQPNKRKLAVEQSLGILGCPAFQRGQASAAGFSSGTMMNYLPSDSGAAVDKTPSVHWMEKTQANEQTPENDCI